MSIVETSSSCQRAESDGQTSIAIHINEKKSTNENKESISVQFQPGPDYPFPMKPLGKKKRSFQVSWSRTFPGFTIPKKRTEFFVYFAKGIKGD